MKLYLVRHAKAGDRLDDLAIDRDRPLSKPGRRQADQIAEFLLDSKAEQIFSSPYRRCIQTMKPMAEKLSLKVETREALAEETSISALSQLVAEILEKGRPVAVCSHGNVIPAMLRILDLYSPDTMVCAKGSIYALDTSTGTVQYFPNPL